MTKNTLEAYFNDLFYIFKIFYGIIIKFIQKICHFLMKLFNSD